MSSPDPHDLKARADEFLDLMGDDGRPLEDRIHEATERARAELNGDGPERGTRVPLFARSLDDFIAAKHDAPRALLGDEDDVLLPAHGLMLLVAKGGKGKTTLVVDQVFHLASGIDWLGFDVARPLRVLIVENEGPREPFRVKLERKRAAWPHPITGAIFVHDQDWGQAKLNAPEFVEGLNRFVVEKQIDLIVGDPLDTLGMEGVGSPEDTRNMVELLKRAGLFSTVAWEVLHHSRKEGVTDAVDEAAGAWGGKPDSMVALEKLPGNRARLSFPKVRWSRRGERGSYLLAFDPEAESFELVREESTEERDLTAEIEALLTEKPYLTAKEIAARDSGIGANVDRVRRQLVDDPSRFKSRTGNDAKVVGRHPSATVWEVTCPTQVTQVTYRAEGSDQPAGDLVTPPYRESPSPRLSPSMSEADSTPESPSSLATPEEEERAARLLALDVEPDDGDGS